eukprot:359690-Chlamydomonas_euryale.AAC.6
MHARSWVRKKPTWSAGVVARQHTEPKTAIYVHVSAPLVSRGCAVTLILTDSNSAVRARVTGSRPAEGMPVSSAARQRGRSSGQGDGLELSVPSFAQQSHTGSIGGVVCSL